jgi:hypothetical protein
MKIWNIVIIIKVYMINNYNIYNFYIFYIWNLLKNYLSKNNINIVYIFNIVFLYGFIHL